MKYLIFIFSVFLFFNGNGQDLARQLQRQMWYVKGDIYRGESFAIYNEKPSNCSGYVNFYNNGEVEMSYESTDVNFFCFYELQNDSMKMSYTIKTQKTNQRTQVLIFYKLRPLPDNNGFEGIPIKFGNR